MLKVSLSSNKRPIFKIRTDVDELRTLLDTGAYMNVYTKSEELFKLQFPDATLLDEKTIISGFGGKEIESSKVYRIPKLKIGDISIVNVPVAIKNNTGTEIGLILASCIFNKWDLIINYAKRRIIVDTDGKELGCLITKITDDKTGKKYIDGFDILIQE